MCSVQIETIKRSESGGWVKVQKYKVLEEEEKVEEKEEDQEEEKEEEEKEEEDQEEEQQEEEQQEEEDQEEEDQESTVQEPSRERNEEDGWDRFLDEESGCYFWFNTYTGESEWIVE